MFLTTVIKKMISLDKLGMRDLKYVFKLLHPEPVEGYGDK